MRWRSERSVRALYKKLKKKKLLSSSMEGGSPGNNTMHYRSVTRHDRKTASPCIQMNKPEKKKNRE